MTIKTAEKPLFVNLNYDKEVIRMAQNENPHGASPKVLEAIKNNMKCFSLYPDVILTELKEKLAKKNNVTHDEIIVAPGSCSLIDQLIARLVKKGENIVIPKLSFIAFKLCAKVHDRECREAEMENYHVSLDNVFSLTDNKTKLIFLANPNNPTGTIFSQSEISSFLEKISSNTIVVLDEAYNEYVTDKNFPDSLNIYKKYENVIILRSFSKIYGLAGLRVGYGIARKTFIDDFESNRIPFTVSSIANIAALTALDDEEHVQQSATRNAKERDFLTNGLSCLGYKVVPSQSNFVFLYFETTEERNKVCELFLENHILVRKMDAFGDDKALRISMGKSVDNKKLVDCLSQVAVN